MIDNVRNSFLKNHKDHYIKLHTNYRFSMAIDLPSDRHESPFPLPVVESITVKTPITSKQDNSYDQSLFGPPVAKWIDLINC
jgi:hypothetical protein